MNVKRSLLVAALTVLAPAACGSSSASSVPPSVSAQMSAAGQDVCAIQAQVLAVIGEIQGTSLQSKTEVVAKLRDLQTKLQDQANTLNSQGATPLADQVQRAADSVGRLADAVESGNLSTIVSAAATAASALGQIPGCASPGLSPSVSP